MAHEAERAVGGARVQLWDEMEQCFASAEIAASVM